MKRLAVGSPAGSRSAGGFWGVWGRRGSWAPRIQKMDALPGAWRSASPSPSCACLLQQRETRRINKTNAIFYFFFLVSNTNWNVSNALGLACLIQIVLYNYIMQDIKKKKGIRGSLLYLLLTMKMRGT